MCLHNDNDNAQTEPLHVMQPYTNTLYYLLSLILPQEENNPTTYNDHQTH